MKKIHSVIEKTEAFVSFHLLPFFALWRDLEVTADSFTL